MTETDERKWTELERSRRRDSGAVTTVESYAEWIAFRVTCVDHGNSKILDRRVEAFERARRPSGWCPLCGEVASMRKRVIAKPVPNNHATDRCMACAQVKTGVSRVSHVDEGTRYLMVCGTCMPTKKARKMIETMFGAEREASRKAWGEKRKQSRPNKPYKPKPGKPNNPKPIAGLDAGFVEDESETHQDAV